MQTLESIVNAFPISGPEYEELEKKFGKLAYYAAWQLKKKNSKNCSVNDPEDDVQDLRIALLRAGSYFKRQTYIEDCFACLESNVQDKFIQRLLFDLRDLWENRRRHGANRQKFGEFQELVLDRLIRKYIPKDRRPDRNKPLQVDAKFTRYCKQIVWNQQRSLGKQIKRESPLRKGLVSLSEFDHLGAL